MTEKAETTKKISVVIVSLNVRDLLRDCLRSVYEGTRGLAFEIFVADNGSTDGSPDIVADEFPAVRLIKNGQNLGFPKANNIILRKILEEKTSGYILLLNPDMVVRDWAIEKLASHLDGNPNVAAVAPAFLLPDHTFQTGTGGFLPTALTTFNYFFFLFKLFPKKAKSFYIDQAAFSVKAPFVRVEWLSGGCLMIRRSIVERIGPMNEDYFIYGEDLDWGRRMTRQGLELHYLPSASVIHHHGAIYDKMFRKINTRWLQMLFLHVKRERGELEYGLVRAFAAGGFSIRLFIYGVLYLTKRDAPTKAKLKKVFRFLTFSLTGI